MKYPPSLMASAVTPVSVAPLLSPGTGFFVGSTAATEELPEDGGAAPAPAPAFGPIGPAAGTRPSGAVDLRLSPAGVGWDAWRLGSCPAGAVPVVSAPSAGAEYGDGESLVSLPSAWDAGAPG